MFCSDGKKTLTIEYEIIPTVPEGYRLTTESPVDLMSPDNTHYQAYGFAPDN